MFDIITCGSAAIDVHARSESDLIKIQTPHHTETLVAFPTGCKVLIDELLYSIGGGGTNTAVAFRRLGLKTGYIGSLGDDPDAKAIKNLLKKEKITFLGHTCKRKTGYSIVLDSLDADRTILVYKGANNELSYNKLKKQKLKAKLFYFSSMIERSYVSQEKIARLAHEQHAKIAFNPSEYQVKKGLHALKSILDYTDIVIFNRQEAGILCKINELHCIFDKLHALGISLVVITDGPRTVYVSDKKYVYAIDPPKINVVEATGAGDAFASGFIGSYIKSQDIEKSLKWGMCNSLSVLLNFGAKNELLTMKKMQIMVKKKKMTVIKRPLGEAYA